MTRIGRRFEALREEGRTGLVAYIMAGDPDLATTRRLVPALEQAGADVIELGVPFTDPLADGPVIQAANERALASGTTLDGILELVADIRRESQVPLLLMTYYNPIFRAGQESVAARAVAAGVDGMLITDLPPEEGGEWKDVAARAGLDTIFLLAPTSTPERIRLAARMASGFVYCVSRTGVTGARAELPADLQDLIRRIREGTDQPIAVGFGVSTAGHVREIGQWADAAVVGSTLVQLMADAGAGCIPRVAAMVQGLKGEG